MSLAALSHTVGTPRIHLSSCEGGWEGGRERGEREGGREGGREGEGVRVQRIGG